jgi:hypothetical protein
MDKSQTPTPYVPPVRGTIVSREIGGRRETAPVSDPPPEIPTVTIRKLFRRVCAGEARGGRG